MKRIFSILLCLLLGLTLCACTARRPESGSNTSGNGSSDRPAKDQVVSDLMDSTGTVKGKIKANREYGSVVSVELYTTDNRLYFSHTAAAGNALVPEYTAVHEYSQAMGTPVTAYWFHNQQLYGQVHYNQNNRITLYVHYTAEGAEANRLTCSDEEYFQLASPAADGTVTITVHALADNTPRHRYILRINDGTLVDSSDL